MKFAFLLPLIHFFTDHDHLRAAEPAAVVNGSKRISTHKTSASTAAYDDDQL